MKLIFLLTFYVVSYASAVEFSSRPRNFSVELLHFTQLEKVGNLAISPFGIWSLLTGVALGATGDSKTQLLGTLRLPKDQNALINGYNNLTKTVLASDSGVVFGSKNFIFVNKGVSLIPKFEEVMQNDFNTEVTYLDFKEPSTVMTANNVIQRFGANVSNVLGPNDFLESNMIFTNVVSFKGVWASSFNESDTSLQPFYDENHLELGKVNMMYKKAPLPYSKMENIEALVIELPYGNDKKYCMLVILPNLQIKVGEVYKKFDNISFTDIFDKLQSDVKEYGLDEIEIKLPRFKISNNLALDRPLNNMGVVNIFDPQLASFDQITDKKIYVSAIVHKSDIEVTESGTVASASTSVNFSDRISMQAFEANRPFIYFVMEKPTITVIFGGTYSQPTVF